jgi:uronate dehydrogenase
MLATWLSYGDMTRLVMRATLAQNLGPAGTVVIWGASKNSRMTWWRRDGRETIGWAPQDSADSYAAALEGKTSGNPVAERYQGGGFTARDYSRDEPPR